MRQSRFISRNNWQYALREVLLIVIGVTLALMATAWYESSRERADELEALGEIRVALESDLKALGEDLVVLRQADTNISLALQFLRSGADYDPQIGSSFSAATVWRGVSIRSAPYEHIKSRGFSLISNSSIRVKLIDLYESHFGALRESSENDRIVSRDQILPYFFARFRRPENRDWEPIDYLSLGSDPVFENLLIAKQRRLQGYVLPAYESAIDAIREILVDIDREIGGADS